MGETKAMPVRTTRVNLAGDYEGFWADCKSIAVTPSSRS